MSAAWPRPRRRVTGAGVTGARVTRRTPPRVTTRGGHPVRRPDSSTIHHLRHLAAVLGVTIVAAGCISGSPARPPAAPDPASPAQAPRVRLATAAADPSTAAAVASVAATTATRSAPTAPARPAAPAPSAAIASTSPDIQGEPTLAQLVGQKLVVRMAGTTPSAALLGRIRRGEVGGVILFGDNIVNATQLKALTSKLHAAAVAGGRPRLLVMTDQEGGLVRRIPWAAPSMSARQMAAAGVTTTRAKGKLAGNALGTLGIDVDLAPVGDVPGSTSSFMWLDQRTFGFDTATVSRLSNAFALGLRDGGTLATMKHFPGIGLATQNTDNATVTIPASLAALQQQDLVPYTAAIANRIPLIMLSNANYPALDQVNGAGWSYAIAKTLLRIQLGFRGVTITDSLTAASRTRGVGVSTLAIAAAASGTDMILVPSVESATSTVYQKLLLAAETQAIPLSRLQVSYKRILALKAGI